MSPHFPTCISWSLQVKCVCREAPENEKGALYSTLWGAVFYLWGRGCRNKLEVLLKHGWWEWGLSVCLCITVCWQATRNLRITTKPLSGNFPGGPMVKNPPSSAEDSGSIPDWGTKIPYAMGQFSPCATITEHTNSGACAQLEKPGCCNKDPTYRS